MRGAILLALFLILIPSTFAQEFLGNISDRTLLIISPLILIGAGLIFFAIIYIKDNYEKIRKAKIVPKIKIKKEEKVEERIKINHLKEIRDFERRLPGMKAEPALKELTGHVKSFFSDKLKLERQFTFEELATKAEDKKGWLEFSKKMSNIKYSEKAPTKNDIVALTNEFVGMVKKESLKERIKMPIKKKPVRLEFLERLKIPVPHIKVPSIKIPIPHIRFPHARFPNVSEKILDYTTFLENYFKSRIERFGARSRTSYLNRLLFYAEKTKGLEKARELYGNYLRNYYKLPVKEQEKFSNNLLKLNKKIKELTLEKEKEELKRLSKDLEKIDKKGYVIVGKTPISKKLKHIMKYADEVRKGKVHSLVIGKKHLIDKINDLVRDVEKLEKRGLHKLSEVERDILLSIKRLYRKPVLEHPITRFDIPVMKEKSKFMESIKDIYSYLRDMEDLGIYKLKPKGRHFLKRLERLMKGEIRLEKEESKLLERFKAPVIDKETETLDLLKDMKTAGMIMVNEPLIEQERMRIEKGELKKVTPWPRISKLKPIKPTATKEMKSLIKEENKLIGKLAEVEKTKMKELPPIERVKARRIEKFNWEKTLEEVKKQKSAEFKNLLKEETHLVSKLNSMGLT